MTTASKNRPALGRGMAALFGDVAQAPAPGSQTGPARAVLSLPVEAIERNVDQPRKRFDDEKLAELAASIAEHGVVEPILVRRDGNKYRIVAGERRWRAAQRAGLKEVPALVREATDREAFELALVENIQRADLNAIEEAEAYDVLVREHGLKQDEVAARVGKERSTVANAIRLLKLPEEVRDAVSEGRLEMGHARALLSLESPEAIRRAAQRAIHEKMSVRATEAMVRALRHPKESRAQPVESAGMKDLVQRLQHRLGARCRITAKTATTGRIEVEYTSLDELDGILAKMGA